jgi:hypothetical protein
MGGGRKKKNPSGGSCTDSNMILGENFGLYLLETLKETDIQDEIRNLFDYDRLAEYCSGQNAKAVFGPNSETGEKG